MENETALLNGQLQTTLDFAGLSGALNQRGVASRIGESSHYAGGYYLRITRGQAQLTFEKIEESEYLIGGDAPSAAEINELAQFVSDILRQLAQRHRFEIYLSLEASRMISYFHYEWSLDELM